MNRVLVVSYYFPPSGGPGVQRVLKFVKYLRGYGYEPEVLTVADGAYPELDLALLGDVPEAVRVHRTKALDPFGAYAALTGRTRKEAVTVGSVQGGGRLAGLARWVRANVFLPDARVGWVPYAAREAARLHAAAPYDVVLTSGPPHSAHLVGRALRRKTGVPWVADLRDPWTGINFYDELPMGRLARRMDRGLERSVLREATRLVTVSPSWKRLLVEQGERSPDEVAVVHNGFDAEDFAAEAPAVQTEAFTLTHVGSLYDSRNPEALWAAIRRLRDQGGLARFRVRLIGRVGEATTASIAREGLEGLVTAEPYAPHDEAVAAMRAATMLLLTIEPFAAEAGMITGKLYEYLAAGRPVLGLGPATGDAARLLAETRGGRMLARDDADGLVEALARAYADWEAGRMPAGAVPEAIAAYSREAQTGRLSEVLDAARRAA